jgi:pimeloyl-ACP methyl ester carboxylesterase
LWQERLERAMKAWGTGQMMKRVIRSQATDPNAVVQFAKLERLPCSPGALRTYMTPTRQIDVSSILPVLQVSTLVLHHCGDEMVDVGIGRRMAEQIPGAKFIEYPDGDHAFWTR